MRAQPPDSAHSAAAQIPAVSAWVFDESALSRVWLGVHHPSDVLAGWLAAATIGILWGRAPWRVPRAVWGMALAHLGVAITLFGITASGALTKELLVNLRIGESAQVGGFDFRLTDVRPVAGANWTALEGALTMTHGHAAPVILHPQARLYTTPMMDTTEAAIHTRIDGDVYAVLGKPDGSGRWQMHIWWKPFIVWIWAGGLIMALGGGLAMTSRARARAEAGA